MTVLITCGFQSAWCDFTQSRLCQVGVTEAKRSDRMDLSIENFNKKLSLQNGLATDQPDTLRQFSPGKAWQIAAADVFMANADEQVWGWSAPENMFLLDFWKDFDPQTRFLLFYGSPAQDLESHISTFDGIPDDLGRFFECWSVFHDELLRFYQANRDRSILVHVDRIEENFGDIARILAERFGIPAKQSNQSISFPRSSIMEMVAERLVAHSDFDTSMLSELDCSADLARRANGRARPLTRLAHQEYSVMCDELNKLKEEEATYAYTVRKERDVFQNRLKELEQNAKEAEKTYKSEKASWADDLKRVKEATQSAKEFELENSLLLKQLHQVQEELERYFRKHQALQEAQSKSLPLAAVSNDENPGKQHSSVAIDATHYLKGKGWHSAEEHGRWAGSELESTICLPALEEGSYDLAIEIVDAMSLEILKGTKVGLGSAIQQPDLRILSDDKGRLAPFRRLKAAWRKVEKPYPALLRTKVHANGNSGQHEIILKYPYAISPLTIGSTDSRNLSICVKSIQLTKSA